MSVEAVNLQESWQPTWQYIAGFFDGEGSVYWIRDEARKTERYHIKFANTDLAVLESIKTFIGAGAIYITPAKGNHKTGYQLVLSSGREVLRISEALINFCCIKRNGLKECIEFTKKRMLLREQLKERFKRDELEQLYWPEKMSTAKIAKIYGVHRETIRHHLKQFGIPRRPKKEALKLYNQRDEND